MSRAASPVLVLTDRRFWRRSIGSEQRIASLVEHRIRRGESLTVGYLGRIAEGEREELVRFCAPLPGLRVRARADDLAGLIADLRWSLVDRLRRKARVRGSSGIGMSSGWRTGTAATAERRANPLLLERSPLRRAFVQRLLHELRPRTVIVEFTRLTPTVQPRDPARAASTRYLIDTHDLLHQRATRFREHGAAVALDVELHEEIEALATYDAILAIQPGDAETIRRLLPEKTVLVVAHGIELPAPGRCSSPLESRPVRLGFLGGRDESNRAGLHWFLDRVWSKLAESFGDRIELRIAGQVCHGWTRAENGMRLLGSVGSIGDFWPTIDIAINPVRFGSGLKIKNVEALAYARALVTSPIGAEGLEAAAPTGLRIAETPEAWLAILTEWLVSPSRIGETGRAGRAYAEKHFSPAAAFAELDAFLDGVARETLGPGERDLGSSLGG